MNKTFLAETVAQVRGPHLLVEPLGDELIVFDRDANRAYLLDQRSAAIWRAAQTGCSILEVVPLAEGATVAERTAQAEIRISDLARVGLLTTDQPVPSRRSLLKKMGGLAAAAGVISLLAPRAEALISSCTRNVTSCATVGANAPDCCAAAPDCRTIVGGLNAGTKRCCVGGGTRGQGAIVLLNPALCCSGVASVILLDLICQA